MLQEFVLLYQTILEYFLAWQALSHWWEQTLLMRDRIHQRMGLLQLHSGYKMETAHHIIRPGFSTPTDDRKTLSGEVITREAIKERDKFKKREKAFKVPTSITFDNEGSEIYTIIEVDTRDRPGLLFDLTRTLANMNVYIASAVIATYGEQVVDSFYVKDMFGLKFHSESKQKNLNKTYDRQLRLEWNGQNLKPIRVISGFLTVGFWTLVSRVLGMVREILLFSLIGAGPLLDAFFAAFRLPNMFRRSLLKALSTLLLYH